MKDWPDLWTNLSRVL